MRFNDTFSQRLLLSLLSWCLLALPMPGTLSSASAQPSSDAVLGGTFLNTAITPAVFLSNGSVSCSGALIGNKTILTAAHCVEGFGRTFPLATTLRKSYRVKSMHRGPNDLGIIALRKSVSARQRFAIRRNALPGVGNRVNIFGFGAPENGFLKGTQMVVAGYLNQNEFFTISIDGSTTCVGDSGGPAFIVSNNQAVIVGVVSRGESACGIGSSTVFPAAGSAVNYRWIKATKDKTEK